MPGPEYYLPPWFKDCIVFEHELDSDFALQTLRLCDPRDGNIGGF
jgi:hypothetical protein